MTETTTDVAPDAVEAAQALVAKLYQQEQEWSAKFQQAQSETADLEAISGAVVLDASDDLAEFTDRLSTAIAACKLSQRAIEEARKRRVEAIGLLYRTQAEKLRVEAAQKRTEAVERQIKTLELLQALRDWEGVDYVPGQPLPEAQPVIEPYDLAPLLTPGGISAGGHLFGPTTRYITIPRTAQLLNEAQQLEAQAAQLERQQVTQSGSIEGISLAHVLEQLHQLPPTIIGPTPQSIEAFVTPRVTALEAKRQQQIAQYGIHSEAGQPVRLNISLLWSNGVLDTAASKVYYVEIFVDNAPALEKNDYPVYPH